MSPARQSVLTTELVGRFHNGSAFAAIGGFEPAANAFDRLLVIERLLQSPEPPFQCNQSFINLR